MTDNGKLIGALLLGVAAGAAIGMLFAPEKGTKTRQNLSDSASDLMDQLQDKIDEGKSALNDLKGKAYSKAEEWKSKANGKLQDLQEEAETEVDYLKNKGKQAANAVR